MNPPTTPTVGIDLGTSNSVLARVSDANHTEILRSSEGDLLVPSVVLFEDNHVYSGEEARLRGRSHPDRLISCVKRSQGENLPAAPVAGVTLPVEVVQACILNKLRIDSERQLGKNFGAVIAVPAFFGDPQRKATADAGQMAGINVLDIINEPVAAALAFSEHSGYLSPSTSPLERRNLLVYDLGGFSFEATVLEVEAGGLKTLATDHDLHLGGHDWDFRIADYLASAFTKQYGHDPRKDPAGLEQLLARAERAKRTLGLRRAARVKVEFQGETLNVELTREHFLEITTDLLQRTAEISAGVLDKAGLKWADVSRVLLVGGATRMTWVRQMLWKLTGQQPDATVNAEEAVARGAAIYAHQLQAMATATGQIPRFRVTNMTTHSLGIEGVDQKTGKKVNTVLIRRGTPLPATATRKFVTKANAQKSITVVVLEGDSTDPDECTKIGRATLRDLPSELSEEWPVDVTYHYSAAGRLKVDAQVRYTDRVVHLEMLRTIGMSFDTIRQWRQLVLSGAGLASMRELLAKEHHPPIALASSGGEPASGGQGDAEQDTGGQIAPRISALASRYASYVMGLFGRGGDSETPETSKTSDGSSDSGENAEPNSKEQKS